MLITLLFNVLISNALTFRREKSILYSRIVMITLLLAAYIALNNLFILCLDKGVSIYGGLFHITPYTQLFNIFILIISAIILTLTSFYPRKVVNINITTDSNYSRVVKEKITYLYSKVVSGQENESFKIIEYPLIILFVIIGALFLMSSSDLISVFLSIELQSYGLYILSTIYRNSEKSTKAGLTYFLLGGLSSCFILLGSSLLYVNSGTTSLEGIYLLSSLSEINNPIAINEINSHNDLGLYETYNFNSWYKPYYIHLSLILIGVGFLFKVSAAPFHIWSPEVYDAIPTIVTTFVAIIAKISIFIFLLELVYYTSSVKTLELFSWSNILLFSSLASLIIGSLLGLVQTRIKKLYAYSTISHVGFILLGLSVNSIESIQAYIFYIITYTLSNLNAFLILIAIGYSLYSYVNKYEEKITQDNNDKDYSPIQLISELKGYYYINPFLAISLSITLFSFVGVPPLFGFFAKQMILSAALDSGYYFMTLVAIITSVIGAVYYLSLIKQIFFFKSDYIFYTTKSLSSLTSASLFNSLLKNSETKDVKEDKEVLSKVSNIDIKWVVSNALSLTISLITLILLLFIAMPNEWLNVANILTLLLFKT